MPELLEVETYRQQAEAIVGRQIDHLECIDPHYWRGDEPPEIFAGAVVTAVRRHGKVMLVDTDGPTLGLHFGMTGRLLVDGSASIDRLQYSSDRDLPEWHRVALRFRGGGSLVVSDARRLGWAEPDPDGDHLGVDAASVTSEALQELLSTSRSALKSRLMDQRRLAGLGNLLTDEILWRGGLDPRREARSLSDVEVRCLHRTLHEVIAELGERGGSHTGDLQPHRQAGTHCPRDGTAMTRETIGGRTTWWCPGHQV